MELVVSKWIRLAVSGRCRHGQWRRARLATGSLSGAERFASLPVLTQLAGFGFKDLSPVTQGRAEGLDDLRPVARSMGTRRVRVAACRVRATMPSSSRASSWCCWALAALRAQRTCRSYLLYHMAGQRSGGGASGVPAGERSGCVLQPTGELLGVLTLVDAMVGQQPLRFAQVSRGKGQGRKLGA